MNEYITTKQAINISEDEIGIRVTSTTIRNWIKDFGIGKKVGGRWYVHKELLTEILQGKIHYENQGRPKSS